jgi:two-component system sensor histidine kinase KdpD
MNDRARDPDELLRQVEEEERRAKRGKLVIFFGAAPGVGKTYSMLEAARTERDLKRDVVIGHRRDARALRDGRARHRPRAASRGASSMAA